MTVQVNLDAATGVATFTIRTTLKAGQSLQLAICDVGARRYLSPTGWAGNRKIAARTEAEDGIANFKLEASTAGYVLAGTQCLLEEINIGLRIPFTWPAPQPKPVAPPPPIVTTAAPDEPVVTAEAAARPQPLARPAADEPAGFRQQKTFKELTPFSPLKDDWAGYTTKKHDRPRTWIAVGIALFVGLGIGTLIGGNGKPEQPETSQPVTDTVLEQQVVNLNVALKKQEDYSATLRSQIQFEQQRAEAAERRVADKSSGFNISLAECQSSLAGVRIMLKKAEKRANDLKQNGESTTMQLAMTGLRTQLDTEKQESDRLRDKVIDLQLALQAKPENVIINCVPLPGTK